MSEGDIRCGDDCILRRLSNGQHYVTTPSEAPTGSQVYECNFDSDLRYQILSHSTVVIHRKSQCPSCQGRSNSPTGEPGRFDGRSATVYRSPGTTNVIYGGRNGNVPGDGHGHVKATGGPTGESVVFWRLPEDEGGQTIVDNSWDITGGNDLDKS